MCISWEACYDQMHRWYFLQHIHGTFREMPVPVTNNDLL